MTDPLTLSDLPRYDVHPIRGFLPPNDPLEQLPAGYEPWDELAAAIPGLRAVEGVRAAVAKLPPLELEGLETAAELRRAMLVLSVLGNAYVWETSIPAPRIPSQLARPWWRVAERLGRPPIAAHASMVLANWRRIDPKGPLELDNLDTLLTFNDLVDERWFYLVTVGIEARGAAAIPIIVGLQTAVLAGDVNAAIAELTALGDTIAATTQVMRRMYERCEPALFYRFIRPVLTGWPEPGVIYEGAAEAPRSVIGGSAAQSSLIQAFDAVLGVRHSSAASGPFLAEMRNYMPTGHREFLKRIDAGPSLRDFVSSRVNRSALSRAYDASVDELDRFRKYHLELAARYVSQEANYDPAARGTGGTEFGEFLGATRRETQETKRRPPDR